MTRTLDAVLLSWPFDPWLVVPLAVTAFVYLRGWLFLRRRQSRWNGWRLTAFLGGLLAIFLAVGSSIETFSSLLLHIHMVQHLLLMMLAPPLLWLGEPLLPLLRGLPKAVRMNWVAPLFRWRWLRRAFRVLTHPVAALPLFVAATWLWHSPPGYELALSSPAWHVVEHACFLTAALLFWYPVVRPYPSRPTWSMWLLLPYLILADVQNTALSALLAFSGQVLYPHYEAVPRLAGLTALEDQAIAGVIMWVPGSVAFLLPLVLIGVRLLSEKGDASIFPRPGNRCVPIMRVALPVVSPSPPRASLLHWKHARLVLQLPLLLLAALVVYDGLSGPQAAPLNLAGVLPWVHWRGLLVFALLTLGNVFCLGCPFVLPRRLLGRWLPNGRTWPTWLRGKWLAVVLLLLFLWAYEAFALWDSPWLTAWIVVGYFVSAFVVDTLFRAGSFCKYVCPLGQFNFVGSLTSPAEVAVRDQTVCRSCTTKDCIRGRDDVPGCETHLFAPRKAGNFDCTFCLDCVHACPHDNIRIQPTTPGGDLWADPQRSGVGRFSRRPDLALLVTVFAFGAFSNAAGMVGPVLDAQRQLTFTSRLGQITLFSLLTLIVVPLLLTALAAWLSRLAGEPGRLRDVATRYAFCLVPLGFAMWTAHYSFHFLTSWDGVVPVAQRLAADAGLPWFGEPSWTCCCCATTPDWLVRLEIVLLDLGLLLSLYTAYRVARRNNPAPQTLLTAAPWAALLLLLFAAGVWIVLQPMQMRGTLLG